MSKTIPSIDLLPDHWAIVRSILRQHVPNREVLAFGSRATWTAKAFSDLDLAIVGDEPLSRNELSALAEAFRESVLPMKVDLVDWVGIDESFRKIIRRDGVDLQIPSTRPNLNEWVGERDDILLGCEYKWTSKSLGECIVMNNSTYSHRDEWRYVNYLETGNITENRVSDIQHLVLVKDKLPSRARRKVNPGDIVYSTVRPNQKHYGLLRNIPENFLASTGFAVFRGKENLADTGYIYWFLTQDYIIEQLQIVAEHSTSAYPSIRPADIEILRIPIPPLPEQRAIASVFETLDRKIELNRRTNETLETMAWALFTDWFVSFGPTCAKAESRAPYLPPEIWDLFPDTLDDGKPSGWEFGTIGTLAKIKNGKRPSTKLSEPDGAHRVPVYGGNGISWYTNETLYNPPFLITGRVGTLGTVFRVYESVWVSDNALCCFPMKSEYFELLYFHLKSLDFASLNSGSTQPLLTQTTLKAQEIVIGEQRIRNAFSECVKPLFSRIVHGDRECETLTVVRDFLLPRLMSGQIRLRDAEKLVEAVV